MTTRDVGKGKQAQTAEDKAKRERRKHNREANLTCTRASNSKGQGPPTARLTTSILPPEGLTNRVGRRGEGPQGLKLLASRPLFYPCGLYKQSGQDAAKDTTQGVEIQPGRDRMAIPQEEGHNKCELQKCTLHGLGPARAHGSNLATRLAIMGGRGHPSISQQTSRNA